MKIKLILSLFAILFTALTQANATPIFAEQYKMKCNACHSLTPTLNKTGLQFLRNGFRFSKDELISQGATRQSANEVEVVQMLEICSVLDSDMAEVEIIAMKPDDIIPVETDLTDKVKESFPKLIDKVLEALKESNITLVKKDIEISLDNILHHYANPKQTYK